MSKYKLTQKTDANGTTQDIQLDASSVDLSGYVPTSRTINSKALSSNITLAAADVKALPNYSLSISTGSGNPREVRFVRVNYSTFDGNNAAYFKIGAMCSHGNGSSYTFLEDIIIGVSSTPSVTCTIYKQVQNASTYTIDSHLVHFGDVYWVVDTTNKYVDFYIIGGQYATLMFTPFMRIGNTVSDTSKIIQYTSATYYSSGTRVWNATGNGSLYARTSDLSGKQDTLVSGTNIKTINNESILGSGNISISGGQATDVQINGTSITSNTVADIKTNGTYNATSNKIATMSDIPSAITSVNGLSGGTISSETTISGNLNAQYVKGTWLYTSAATDLSSWTDVFVNSGGWLYKRAKASFISDLGVPNIKSQTFTSITNIFDFITGLKQKLLGVDITLTAELKNPSGYQMNVSTSGTISTAALSGTSLRIFNTGTYYFSYVGNYNGEVIFGHQYSLSRVYLRFRNASSMYFHRVYDNDVASGSASFRTYSDFSGFPSGATFTFYYLG